MEGYLVIVKGYIKISFQFSLLSVYFLFQDSIPVGVSLFLLRIFVYRLGSSFS